MVSKSVTKH